MLNRTMSCGGVALMAGFFCACSGPAPKLFSEPVPLVAAAEVVNVRAEPVAHSGEYKFDPLQETQLERGEPVLAYELAGGWYRIEAPEQLEFTHNNRWEGYPGWVPAAALTDDLTVHHTLKLSTAAPAELRETILAHAERHLGHPYLWGGRSLHNPANAETATGVDCSGLVNWSFRQVGWFVPRDSHEQYLRARKIEASELDRADLIFLAKPEDPEKIIHVGFYAGGDEMLEAPSTGEKVRRISGIERFGIPIQSIQSGDVRGGRIVYFGSFFAE